MMLVGVVAGDFFGRWLVGHEPSVAPLMSPLAINHTRAWPGGLGV
jgi:hypothetical protein